MTDDDHDDDGDDDDVEALSLHNISEKRFSSSSITHTDRQDNNIEKKALHDISILIMAV